MSKIVCRKCKEDTETRIVIKRFPLKITKLSDDHKELYCSNIIKHKKKGRKINNWIEEECRNRIIIKKIKRKKQNAILSENMR